MMNLPSVFLAALFSVFSLPAFASFPTSEADCTPLDFRTELPLKMRDQGNISWCYAHASADYLQFYHHLPVQISAADIAATYNHRVWPKILKKLQKRSIPETGFAKLAIEDITKIGYCPEEFFPSETWTKQIRNGKDAGKTMNVPIKEAVAEIAHLVTSIRSRFYRNPSDLPFVYRFAGMSDERFYETIFVESERSVFDLLREKACADHRLPFPKTISHVAMEFKSARLFPSINETLNRGLPVTVDFFAGYLNDADHYSKSVSDLHTTILLGRRYHSDTHSCEYLIKNSHGTDCSGFDSRHRCDAGYFWLNEGSFFGALVSFVQAE